MEVTAKFLEMLLAGASREDLDVVLAEASCPAAHPSSWTRAASTHWPCGSTS